MDQTTLQAIKDAVAKHNDIGIVVGKNPNLDGMAAALSLYLALRQIGKNVSVASPSEPLVEISSLVGIDKIKTSLATDGGDLIVSFPYKEGEIEKVSYTLEEGFLNIVVKAGGDGLSFNEKDIRYKRQGVLPTLLFVVATSRLSDLGSLFDPIALKDVTVVNIDNKVENQGFGEIVYVTPKFSSVSEMVSDLLLAIDISLDIDTAQNLLSGISFATNNFGDPKTSFLAFEMAAVLMKKGAVRQSKQLGEEREIANEDAFFRPKAKMPQPFTRVSPQQQPSMGGSNFPKRQFPRKTQQPHQGGSGFPQSPQPQNPINQQKEDSDQPPSDWLTPKVYKGSTNLG